MTAEELLKFIKDAQEPCICPGPRHTEEDCPMYDFPERASAISRQRAMERSSR